MSLETGLIFIGVIAAGVLFVWYLYRRSQKDTDENVEEPTDNADDDFEDLLLTGIVLGEVLDDDDAQRAESNDVDSDGHDDGFDGGYDDGGTLE